MFDDVIILRSISFAEDEYLNQVEQVVRREVFCQIRNITRSEYYQAAQTDLHPQLVITISHYKDYLGEAEVEHRDWTGKVTIYDVIRTYRVPGSDAIELTVQERIGDYNGEEYSGSDGESSGGVQPRGSGCGQCSG